MRQTDIPSWYERGPALHVTTVEAADAILTDGLCVPLTGKTGIDFSFDPLDWAREVYISLENMQDDDLFEVEHRLKRDSRSAPDVDSIEHEIERTVSWLSKNTSLFWVTHLLMRARDFVYVARDEAKRGENYQILDTNLAMMPFYWWFTDPKYLGGTVFVLPTDCPQAPPEAFTVLA